MVLSVVIIVIAYLFYIFSTADNIGNGYKHIWGRADNNYLVKNGGIAIEPTIVDWDLVNDFAIGLRLPAYTVVCEDGDSHNIMIKNLKEYFILNIKTDEIFNFNSKQIFESKLRALQLSDMTSLDYSKFDEIWKIYNGYYKSFSKYYSTCRPESEMINEKS